MDMQLIKSRINAKDMSIVESAWLEAIQANAPTAEMANVLEMMVAAGRTEMAQTCANMLVDERLGQAKSGQADAVRLAFDTAKAAILAVPSAQGIRPILADLYRKLYGSHQYFDALLSASGLLLTQSPKRAIRTLDTCLQLTPDTYLANRFDSQVVKVRGYNATFDEYEVADAAGRSGRTEPKNLADEFDIVPDTDFRVLCQHRGEELSKLLSSDPAPLLVAICQSSGGKIAANALKEMLVPKYITVPQWSDWWSRARTAAKKHAQLCLEGRSPVTISYHPQGRTLEEELAALVQAAKTPLERMAVLQQYLREIRGRKLQANAAFVGPILEALAEQAATFLHKRPSDALAAALAMDDAQANGLTLPANRGPQAFDVLMSTPKPAQALANLEDTTLWPAGLAAMVKHPDAVNQMEILLELTPTSQLDAVASQVKALGRAEAITKAVTKALASPSDNLEVFFWLWKGPAETPANMPGKTELLTRLLSMVVEVDHDWSFHPGKVKTIRQRARAALSASDYASYRQALSEMNEGVAGTVKRLIERTDGLAEAVHDDMMGLLREHFFGLFVKDKIDPWLDEGVIWTTEASLHRREDELKHLTDVTMLENARAIGEAAEHGDLSENADWKSALEERDMLRARAGKMQDELGRARVLRAENIPTETVGIGSRVTLKRVSDGNTLEMTFLGPWDINIENGIYNYQSPVSKDLMGRGVGATVTLKLDGAEGEYVIEKTVSAL